MTRHDFVSNSSSSSFLVFGDPTEKELKWKPEIREVSLPDNTLGGSKFGWDHLEYSDFFTKLNFCAIQIHYIDFLSKRKFKNRDYYYKQTKKFLEKYPHKTIVKMLTKVCKDKFDLKVTLKNWDEIGEESWNYYIDHQSSATEFSNMGMFDSEDKLYRFLVTKSSYIQGGNDNDPY